MSKQLFSAKALAALVRAGDSRQFGVDLKNNRQNIIEEVSGALLNAEVDLANHQRTKIKGKDCISYGAYAAHIRLISERYKVSFSALSGKLFSALTVLVKRSIAALSATNDDGIAQAVTQMTAALLQIIFHIAALDTRVRPSYRICQIAIAVSQLAKSSQLDAFDQLIHLVKDELDGLIQSLLRREADGFEDSVELYNFLITGAQYCGNTFLEASGPKAALDRILGMPKLSYFGFVTAKFCFLKDRRKFASQLSDLNRRARARLDMSVREIPTFAEIYLFACDYLSSPDISDAERRTWVEAVCGGSHSNADTAEAAKYLAFVDWDGVRIMHMLERRQLRPVYSWS